MILYIMTFVHLRPVLYSISFGRTEVIYLATLSTSVLIVYYTLWLASTYVQFTTVFHLDGRRWFFLPPLQTSVLLLYIMTSVHLRPLLHCISFGRTEVVYLATLSTSVLILYYTLWPASTYVHCCTVCPLDGRRLFFSPPFQLQSWYYTIHYDLRPLTSSVLLYLIWTDGACLYRHRLKLNSSCYTIHYDLRPLTSTVALYFLWTDGGCFSRHPLKLHSCCYTIHDHLRPLTSSVVLFFLRTDGGFICREPVILQSSYFTIYYSIHDHMHPLTYYYGVCFLCIMKNVWTKLSHWYAKRTMKCVKLQMVRNIYIAHCT